DMNFLPLDISGDFNPFTIGSIKSFIKKNEIEFVIVNFTKDIRLGGIAARWEGSSKVIWSVGLDITKDSLSHKILTPKLIDGVLTPSEALKKQITKLEYIKPELVKVIPIGIPELKGDKNRAECRKRINTKYNITKNSIISVTSGRFVNQKGHIYLIEAAVEIVKHYPEIKFLLLGDGPNREMLEEKISELNLSKHFIITGMLDNLSDELTAADIMIHPSVEEPYGIAILEGMRAGLPVVASEVGGIPEVVINHQTAELVQSENPTNLSKAIINLLSDREKMNAMGVEGMKRWGSLLNLSNMIDNIENYLIQFSKVDTTNG
ncbi:MAG: glycosyltransferase family 4 protein, partial [candidate division Zixibacteria bacterium]|nr:glycosyltransferase family 4 protein [candidate division Zixibacteria bacterium]